MIKQITTTGNTTTNNQSVLTKREQFAAAALSGLAAKYTMSKPEDQETITQMAVELADNLIKTLNELE